MKTRHTLKLLRKYGAEGTNGTITFNGEHICYTIELPDQSILYLLWIEGQLNDESCPLYFCVFALF